MMTSPFRFVIPVACLLLIFTNRTVAEKSGDARDTVTVARNGLVFSAEYRPQKIFLNGESGNGALVTIGVGYLMTPSWQADLKIYAGGQNIAHSDGRPIAGHPLLGGAGLELMHTFIDIGIVHPYAGAGYGFFNLLTNGIGYAGYGPVFNAGARYDLSVWFALRSGISYGWIHYHDLTGDFPPGTRFTPFSVSLLSATISISFYPNLMP